MTYWGEMSAKRTTASKELETERGEPRCQPVSREKKRRVESGKWRMARQIAVEGFISSGLETILTLFRRLGGEKQNLGWGRRKEGEQKKEACRRHSTFEGTGGGRGGEKIRS